MAKTERRTRVPGSARPRTPRTQSTRLGQRLLNRLWPRRRWAQVTLVGVVLLAVVIGIAAAAAGVRSLVTTVTAQPPGVGTIIVAPAASKAHAALGSVMLTDLEREATAHLAAQPTAYWLTPEQDPRGIAARTVLGLATQARAEDAALAVVIYGLPGRDCGNHSAGGLPPTEYQAWVSEISDALDAAPDVQKIVILEPDSLGLAEECGNLDERVEQLRGAVTELASSNTWIYLDGGHSGWHAPAHMAALIDSVDVAGNVRGFATNVSNYRSTYDEFAYAHAVAAHLPGMHAVIDTSRNGAASAGDAWCNPPGQRVGDPGGTYGDEIVDTNLWIKPPGESDGPCNGGPAAGVYWPKEAVNLTKG